jgi:hypothetical protein
MADDFTRQGESAANPCAVNRSFQYLIKWNGLEKQNILAQHMQRILDFYQQM